MPNIFYRIDTQKVDKFEITPQGFLQVQARLTRTGVFDYYDASGKLVREYRPPEEVFAVRSMDTLKLAPLTFIHPKKMVTANNVKHVDVGTVGEKIEKDGEFIKATVQVRDSSVIQYIWDKKNKGEDVELSCGYEVKLVENPGEHPKEGRYDLVQTEIVYNHVAIVDKGRAGSEVKLIMDSLRNQVNEGEDLMDAKLLELMQQKTDAEAQVSAITAKKDEAEKALKEKTDAFEAQKVKLDELQAKFDEMKAEKEKLQAKLDAEEEEKNVAFVADVAKKLKVKVDGMDSKAAKIACIKAVHPNFESKNDVYDNARFDAIAENLKLDEEKAKLGEVRKNITDAGGKPEEKLDARQKYLKEQREAAFKNKK